MKIVDCIQGSPQWLNARLGIVTASELDNLISPEWKARSSQGVETYLHTKLCEKIMGVPLHDTGSWAMGQGSLLEGEALPWFEFEHDTAVKRIGFCTTDDGLVGCSPDGLIGEDGGIEIKCPQPATHLRYLLRGQLPKEYAAQVHGSMFVTGRKWWNFLSYSRQFPPLLVRVNRDEKIQRALADAIGDFLTSFNAKLDEISALQIAYNEKRTQQYYASLQTK